MNVRFQNDMAGGQAEEFVDTSETIILDIVNCTVTKNLLYTCMGFHDIVCIQRLLLISGHKTYAHGVVVSKKLGFYVAMKK